MKKFLLVLAIGIAFGYSLGFKDAQRHDDDVVTRMVSRARGLTGEKYRTNVDDTMDRLEKR
jgi:hypothetical protein